MSLTIRKIQAWSGDLPERPGGGAGQLDLLARAGADLAFVFARPHPTKPLTSRLVVAPIVGAEQTRAACAAGLAPTTDVGLLLVEGADRPGLGGEIMTCLAVAGLPLNGWSMHSKDGRVTAYLAFDDVDLAAVAVRLLANLV